MLSNIITPRTKLLKASAKISFQSDACANNQVNYTLAGNQQAAGFFDKRGTGLYVKSISIDNPDDVAEMFTKFRQLISHLENNPDSLEFASFQLHTEWEELPAPTVMKK